MERRRDDPKFLESETLLVSVVEIDEKKGLFFD